MSSFVAREDGSTFADDLQGAQEMLQKFKTSLLHFLGIEASVDAFERYALWSLDHSPLEERSADGDPIVLLDSWPHLKPSMFLRDDEGPSPPADTPVAGKLTMYIMLRSEAEVAKVLPYVQRTVVQGIMHDEEQMTKAMRAAGCVFAQSMQLEEVYDQMRKG